MIDHDLIKSFMWESTDETFGTMISLPIEKVDEEDVKLDPSVSLICTITFTGPLMGVFAVQCSAVTAESIARVMLMSDPDDVLNETEISDALGEVANMLLGGLKAKMAESVGEIQISIPSVIRGVEIRPGIGKNAIKTYLNTKIDGAIMKMTLVCKGKS